MNLEVRETESNFRSFIQEALQHLIIIKAFSAESRFSKKLEQLHRENLDSIIHKNRLTVSGGVLVSAGYWAGYLLAFLWGSWLLSLKQVTFGTFTAFLQLVGQVQEPLVELAHGIPEWLSVTASAERLIELESLAPDVVGENAAFPESAGFSLQSVWFDYSTEVVILKGISMQASPGEIIALTGASGEGKTTMLRLMMALVQPTDGSLHFTNSGKLVPISPDTRSWVSYVPQGNTLFSGSIAENLRLGDAEADEAELREALIAADAWDFVSRLPEGVHTWIGEEGTGLSEGQAQRIAIARAFLKKAPVLVLDEATSALDADTEVRVLESLRQWCGNKTCLVITHRPSAIKICNRVYHLSSGILSEVSVMP